VRVEPEEDSRIRDDPDLPRLTPVVDRLVHHPGEFRGLGLCQVLGHGVSPLWIRTGMPAARTASDGVRASSCPDQQKNELVTLWNTDLPTLTTDPIGRASYSSGLTTSPSCGRHPARMIASAKAMTSV